MARTVRQVSGERVYMIEIFVESQVYPGLSRTQRIRRCPVPSILWQCLRSELEFTWLSTIPLGTCLIIDASCQSGSGYIKVLLSVFLQLKTSKDPQLRCPSRRGSMADLGYWKQPCRPAFTATSLL